MQTNGFAVGQIQRYPLLTCPIKGDPLISCYFIHQFQRSTMTSLEEDLDGGRPPFLFWFGFTIFPVLITIVYINNPRMDLPEMGFVAFLFLIHLVLVLITTAILRKKQLSKGLRYSFIPSLILVLYVNGLFAKPDFWTSW